MPSKKGTKAKTQKQKQKQKQTVIVNINNEKPKTKRKRKPTQRKSAGASSHIPVDAVRDILFQLSKATHTPDSTITRALVTTRSNPQAEIVKDKAEEAQLPNRPPATMTSNDAEIGILRANVAQQSPFSFSEAEDRQEDINRLRNRFLTPTTPLDAYLEQISQPHTPLLQQPPPQIHISEGPSGTDAIGEVDYDLLRPDHGNAMAQYIQQTSEVGQTPIDFLNSRERAEMEDAKDEQWLADHQSALVKTELPTRFRGPYN